MLFYFYREMVIGLINYRMRVELCRIVYDSTLEGIVMKDIGGFLSWVFVTMQLGGMAGLTALTMEIGQDKANKEKESGIGKQE